MNYELGVKGEGTVIRGNGRIDRYEAMLNRKIPPFFALSSFITVLSLPLFHVVRGDVDRIPTWARVMLQAMWPW